MTKYCRDCWLCYADRFNYCPVCGKKLELYDRHYREDEVITHKEIINEIKESNRKSIFNYYIGISLALASVSVAYSFYRETQGYAIFYLIFSFVVIIIGWVLGIKKVNYKIEEWKKSKEKHKK